jgi:hypothetical protein
MKNLFWLAGLVAAGVACWQFYLFVWFRDAAGSLAAQGGSFHLWLAIAATVAACAFAFLGFFRRINQTETIHITQ